MKSSGVAAGAGSAAVDGSEDQDAPVEASTLPGEGGAGSAGFGAAWAWPSCHQDSLRGVAACAAMPAVATTAAAAVTGWFQPRRRSTLGWSRR